MRKIYWTFLFVLGFFFDLFSQNTYWTQQYSSYANIMGGAMMSNSTDNSTFYYNPGAIGFIDTGSINVSANIYGYDRIRLRNGAGFGLDLVSNKMSMNAQVLAGNLYFAKAPRWRFVYGYILRNFSRFDFEQDFEMDTDIIPGAPGSEFYRGKFDYTYQNGEHWGGIGLGYQINENISVGLGHYGGYTNTRNTFFRDISVDATSPDSLPYVASTRERKKYQLDHFYIMFKPGIDMRFGSHKIGLAAMLPSVRMFGRAKMYQSLELTNFNIGNTDTTNAIFVYPNFLVVGDERKVKTVMKVTPSISLGYEYEVNKWKISFVTEYFFPMREYDLVRGTKPVHARPEEAYNSVEFPDFMRISTGTYGVWNFGIGADWRMTKKIRAMTGFRTDFNNKVPMFRKNYKDYITSVDPQFWNYLHFSFGITIEHKNRKTYVGLLYKYGYSQYNKNMVNMSNPSMDNFFLGSNINNMGVDIHGVGITLGYSIFSKSEKGLMPMFDDIDKKKKKRAGKR